MGARFLFEAYPIAPVFIMAVVNVIGEIQLSVALNPDGTLSVYRGNLATELAVANRVLSLDTFYRIGFRGKVDRLTGTAEILLNRTAIARAPIGNTAESDVIPWAGCVWGLPEDCAVNHWYCGDAFGHHPDLLPDLIVKALFPLTTTGVDQWDSNSGPSPFAIDDPVQDGDITRLDASSDQDAFLVGLTDLVESPAIYAAQAVGLVKNTESDVPAFRFLHGFNDLIVEGDVDWAVPMSDYTVRRAMYWQSADGGEGWTTARVNATTLGGPRHRVRRDHGEPISLRL